MTKLKEMRLAAGFTQAELAAAAKMSIRALQAYEGKGVGCRAFDSARLKTILKVCKVLGCTLSEIVEDHELKELLKVVKAK